MAFVGISAEPLDVEAFEWPPTRSGRRSSDCRICHIAPHHERLSAIETTNFNFQYATYAKLHMCSILARKKSSNIGMTQSENS